MNLTIWKFPLKIADRQLIEMPTFAHLLSIGVQHDQICLWASVVPQNTFTKRVINICGTGHPQVNGKFIGTCVMNDGLLVWHVFDGGEVS